MIGVTGFIGTLFTKFFIILKRGIKLFSGQGQRIALVRALYDASENLILDEAMASLDNET